jgi:hypothetical protein
MKGIGLKGIGLVSAIKSAGQFGSPIYGASWTGVASPVLTRTDEAIGKVANAGVDAGAVVNNFDSIYPWSGMIEVIDALGNIFIRIPKFYIEKTAVGAARTWRISASPFGSSYCPEPFKTASYVDVGKYNANLNIANLESKPATFPLVNTNIVNFRTYAMNNGAGYYQMDIHVVDLIRTLFYIEFATLNSQSIMAGFISGQWNAAHTATVNENAVNRVIVANATAAVYFADQAVGLGTSLGGNQIFSNRVIQSIDVYDAGNKAITVDGAAFNVAIGNIIYNLGWKAGFSASIAAKSGSLVSNSSGYYPCKYREIENPWGNIWQFIDGVNINEYQAWVCRTPANYASNVFAAPYEQLSYVNHNADGYMTTMGLDPACPFAEFPTAVGGASTTYYSDYYYRNPGQRIALLGGGWYHGTDAGLSCWYLCDNSFIAYIAVGGRLLKTAL